MLILSPKLRAIPWDLALILMCPVTGESGLAIFFSKLTLAKAPVVSYAPAPKVAYKPYVDQYADEPAYYTYEYAVNDDYSNSAFDANESREQYLTTGKYSV